MGAGRLYCTLQNGQAAAASQVHVSSSSSSSSGSGLEPEAAAPAAPLSLAVPASFQCWPGYAEQVVKRMRTENAIQFLAVGSALHLCFFPIRHALSTRTIVDNVEHVVVLVIRMQLAMLFFTQVVLVLDAVIKVFATEQTLVSTGLSLGQWGNG